MQKVGLFVLGALAFLQAAWPQASSSTVRGNVTDPHQAVVPHAAITLTNTATNVARSTLTNESGAYVFPGVFPGPYRLTAESPGMQKYEGNLTVQAQQDATVDVVLQVGQTVTQVDVQDVTPMVTTSNPTLSHTLERQRIEELPVNGRSYQSFLSTVPGIDSTGLVQAYGMRTNTSTTLFDGAPVNEVWEGWDFGRVPGLDALEEMHVETNNSSAKFARPVTVLLSSKGGTNQFHGDLFETIRNSGIGVARRRQDTFTKPPYLNRNEFGLTVGGPVYLPKIYNGRNRTFFFVSWEGLRQRAYTTNQYSVPTEAMRNGDFSELKDIQGRLMTLYDPFSTDTVTYARTPLSYNGRINVIDPSRITKLAKFLFAATPLPNQPGINPLLGPNLIVPTLIPTTQNTTSIRIDHRFSDKDNLFGRLTLGTNDHWLGTTVMLPISIGDYPNAVATSNRHWPNVTGALTWVHTFSSSTTNEVVLNASRDYQWRGSGDKHTNYAAALGLPNPFQAANWPNFTNMGLGAYPFGTAGLFWLVSNFGLIEDNATKIHRNHEFQFGIHIRDEWIGKSAASLAGSFDSNTLATSLYDPSSTPQSPQALPLTGFGLANFELGVLNYNASFQRRWYNFRRQEFDPYFQDNWKVTRRLTLNLGLRYEIRSPLYDKDGTLLGFDFAKHSLVTGTSVDNFIQLGETTPAILGALRNFGGNLISYQDAGTPQKLVYRNWHEFGPRLGFAYRAFEGRKAFVVRGGYRISYYPQKLQDWVGSQSSSVPVGASFSNSVTNTALSPDGLPNYGLRSVPQYIAGVNTPDSIINTSDTRLLARGFNVGLLDPHHTDGRIQDWNVTFEKELRDNMVMRIGYIGNYSDNQQQEVHYNDATPDYIWYATTKSPLPTGPFANVATRPYDQQVYGNITLYAPTGYARYNGVQVELERRFHKGFGFQFFWNHGNTMLVNRDTDGTQSVDAMLSTNNYLPGTVPADFDARNRFLNYKRDSNTPKHQIRWNFIAELPVGRGKKLLGNSTGVVEKLVGGWQIAGLGNNVQGWWSLPTDYYPTGNPIEYYGFKYPIQDCTSGSCFPGYLYFNGYIPANRINSVDANGKPNGIEGVPANYKPATAPLIPQGQTALPPNAPAGTNVSSFWDTNNVWIPLNNGTVQRVVYNNNLNPWRNQYVPLPWQWFQDASAFKFIRLKERVTLRFNVDFFNVFNHPNNPTSIATTGILSTRNSGSAARTTQLGARLQW
jgi:hypothetical protein